MPARIGKYQGLELIGKGATASVYLAQHPDLRQPRAIKVFETGRIVDREGLLPEAVHQAGLKHNRILQVYDQEVDAQTGKLYLVMEYASCGSLRDILDNGPLDPPLALKLAAQAAGGLAAAHGAGICHLDIKPENILLRGRDDALIGDFGLAVAGESGHDGPPGGTPNYMAPEQVQGSYGCHCDIWALGAVLYEMLTGHLCFEGDNRETIVQAILGGPGDIAARMEQTGSPQPARVCNLLHRMLETDPAGRMDAAGASQELEALAEEISCEAAQNRVRRGIPTEATQWRCCKCGQAAPWGLDTCLECAQKEMKSLTQPTAKRQRIGRKALIMAACAVLVLVGSLAAGAYIWRDEPTMPGAIALVRQTPTPVALQPEMGAMGKTPPAAEAMTSAEPEPIASKLLMVRKVSRFKPVHAQKQSTATRFAKAKPVKPVQQTPKISKAVLPGNDAIFKAMAGTGRRAENMLRERLRSQPNHTGASRNLALLLMEQQRYNEAMGILHNLVHKHPGDTEAKQALEITKRLLANGKL